MYKFKILISILFVSCASFAQNKSKIILQHAADIIVTIENQQSVSHLKKPIFKHDNAILTCDSALFYADKNYFEAFENVHINQADTVNIYANFLNYDGNQKKAHLNTNVRLLDKNSVLTTEILDYDMVSRIGTYLEGGRIVSKDVNIESKNGFYFANTKDAYFKHNVVVVTPQNVIKSDTLKYNTQNNWAYFYGPTNIKGKDDNLYTENGQYNTKSQNAFFSKGNLYTQNTKTLTGDSLYFDGRRGYGKAIKNIVFKDSKDKVKLQGQLGEYYKSEEKIVVTQKPFLSMETNDSTVVNNKKQADTLWLGADTLESKMVLLKSVKRIPQLSFIKKTEVDVSEKTNLPIEKSPANDDKKEVKKETIAEKKLNKLPIDTAKTRIIKAFHHVKVYKHNIQAKADSLFFCYADSTLRWFKKPMVWAEDAQQSGDTIYVQLKDKKVHGLQIVNNGFIVNIDKADTTKFNQIKGKEITGFFKNNALHQLFVDGNAESIYYSKGDSGKENDVNQTVSSQLKFIFEDKEITDIFCIKNVEGRFSPLEEGQKNRLTGFSWLPDLKPKNKEEITGEIIKPKKANPKTAPKKTTKGRLKKK